ncbi:AAA family ATPase [Luteibacter sp. UNCMF366Tsu5.1]|uniref:AAA family ATPase n=1 Tax=Luteibacter sp. UNCMF366Tsu5.1 TaxID=1502758 RepID=UPI0009086716|nr:AAA family ATPase [Luteibacter sp. UNCMF366Tsu5.1]SFW67647.1 AAA domain-containing protein [Luteibacter sp. UNCMF366Tsu5.1]
MAATGGTTAAPTIESWLNERRDWLRRAASEFLTRRRHPTQEEIAALADHCLAEAKQELKEKSAPLEGGSIEAVPTGPEIRLKSVSQIKGVNALRPDAVLNLDQGNLTVVYGTNGSGKTGYARLIKEVCGAKAKDDRLYGNVFDGDNTPPEAMVVVTIDSKDQPAHPWKLATGAIRNLVSTVQVFDTTAATLFTDKSNAATHEPRAMRFLSGLITISEGVAAELRRRRDFSVSKLPSAPAEHANTPAAQFFAQIAKAKPHEIKEACALPKNIDEEIAELEEALAAEDPAGKIAALTASLQRNTDIRSTCEDLANGLADATISIVVTARKEATTKRAAATAFAKELFEGIPLAGVGEAVWRELWAHAKDYSEKVAYVGSDYPVLGDQARCVLCQQELGDEAKGRMRSFSEYLEGALETTAKAAEQVLSDAVADFIKAPEATFWPLVEAATGLTEDALRPLQTALSARFEAADKSGEPVGLPPLDFSRLLDALNNEDLRLQRERAALIAVAGAQGRAEKTVRLGVLKAQKWLASIEPSLLEECERQSTLKSLDDAVALTATNALTKKVGEIANDYLVGGYVERFNRELAVLGGSQVRVKLNTKSEGKGRFSFSLDLRDSKTKVAPRLILSEGEQRAVALASFLADVTGAVRAAPVIFDDPISSLDQDFEEAVATRLVELSQTRQVIVFTHRLSMMTLLQVASNKMVEFGQQVSVAVQVIARTADGVGMPSEFDIFSQKPKAGLNNLIQGISSLGNVPANVEPFARAGLCSTFRLFLEKIVEYHLCADVIARYRRDVQTKNKIAKLSLVTIEDCQIIDEMMSKYSGFVHSQAQEAPAKIPSAEVLKDDVTQVKNWLDEFDQRVKAAFPGK